MKNNFDMSSTGVNIELAVLHDHDASHTRYSDAKHGAEGWALETYESLYGRNCVLAVFYASEDEKDEPHYTKTALRKMSRRELEELYYDYDNCYLPDTKKEMVDELHDMITKEAYYKLEAGKGFQGMEVDTDFTSSGYSQGDAIKVCITKKCAKEHPYINQSFVDRLFWDSPYYARLEVEVEDEVIELCTYDLLDDEYEWDSDSFTKKALKAVKKHLDLVAKEVSLNVQTIMEEVSVFLKDNVPTYP